MLRLRQRMFAVVNVKYKCAAIYFSVPMEPRRAVGHTSGFSQLHNNICTNQFG